jgi:hypothetical protein
VLVLAICSWILVIIKNSQFHRCCAHSFFVYISIFFHVYLIVCWSVLLDFLPNQQQHLRIVVYNISLDIIESHFKNGVRWFGLEINPINERKEEYWILYTVQMKAMSGTFSLIRCLLNDINPTLHGMTICHL